VGLEEAVAAESHRRLTACTYVGGGSGTKCVGTNACSGLDESKVGCGSCIGTNACAGFYGNGTLTIGEKSCIGDNSCQKIYAKDSVSPVVIGDGSCLNGTGKQACYNVYAAYEGGITVGNGSCHDNVGCKYLQGSVGSNSCVGGDTIGYDGDQGYVCYNFIDSVTGAGDGSCNDYAACYQIYGLNYYGDIGDSSCNGDYTCNWVASRNTGFNSCNGSYACSYVTGKCDYLFLRTKVAASE
jgi:hypothetical protein